MRVRVGQRSKTIVIFLSSGIPKSQFNVLAVNLDVGNVIFKDGRNVNLAVIHVVLEKSVIMI